MCDCKVNLTLYNGTTYEDETCAFSFNPDLEDICCNLQKYLDVELRLIVCIGGFIFNTLAILLFFDKKLSSEMFNRLLLCLVFMDNLYLLIGIIEVLIHGVDRPSYGLFYFYMVIIYPARGIIMCCIIYTTLMLAFQRYKSITKPLNNLMRNSNSSCATWLRVLKFVGPVILFSILYKLPECFEVSIESHILDDNNSDMNSSSLVISEKIVDDGTNNISTQILVSDLKNDKYYVLLYVNIGNIIVTGFAPLMLLAYFNFYIYKGMHRFAKQRSKRRGGEQERDEQQNEEARNQRNQTIILFSIVIIFIVCHTLRIILNIEDFIIRKTTVVDLNKNCTYGHPYWYLISMPVSEILLRLNSSINFFIYCAFNNSFRRVLNERIIQVLKLCGLEKCLERSSRNGISYETELATVDKPSHQLISRIDNVKTKDTLL